MKSNSDNDDNDIEPMADSEAHIQLSFNSFCVLYTV